MKLPDYSEFLKQPGKLENEENAWLRNPQVHDEYARVVNEVIKEHRLKSVTEIGCGTGEVAKRIKRGVDYYGIDANPQCVLLAMQKGIGRMFIVGDIRETRFLGGSDLVCTFAVLKHFGLHEWFDVFKRIASLGKYFVFNMQIASEIKDDFFEFHHVWKSRKDLENDIAGAGLELLKVENENSLEPIFICKNKI